jgi:hypothetical protein
VQLRTNHSNTSTAVVLRLSILGQTWEFEKVREQMIASATAIVIATAVYAGAAKADGGGGGPNRCP